MDLERLLVVVLLISATPATAEPESFIEVRTKHKEYRDVTLIHKNPLGICVAHGPDKKRVFLDFNEIEEPPAETFGYSEDSYQRVKIRDELILPDRRYERVVIKKISPLGIQIQHEGGIAMLYFPELPEDIRSQFCFSERAYSEALSEGNTTNNSRFDPRKWHEQSERVDHSKTESYSRQNSNRQNRSFSKRNAKSLGVERYSTDRYTSTRSSSEGNQRTERYSGNRYTEPTNQCMGTTEEGRRCKNRVKGQSYCHHHRWSSL